MTIAQAVALGVGGWLVMGLAAANRPHLPWLANNVEIAKSIANSLLIFVGFAAVLFSVVLVLTGNAR